MVELNIIKNGFLKGKSIVKKEHEALKRLGVNFSRIKSDKYEKGVFIKLRKNHVIELSIINKKLKNINELTNSLKLVVTERY